MKKNGGSIHTVDVLFPLLFILLFCFCALLVVLQGARIYEKTAAYGHFGREDPDFTWERTNRVDELRDACGIKA